MDDQDVEDIHPAIAELASALIELFSPDDEEDDELDDVDPHPELKTREQVRAHFIATVELLLSEANT